MELVSIKSKVKKRIGRGLSAGQGKTAGRGTKGQKSRSGHNIPRKFEGGQTPLSMRLPKLPGFKSKHEKAIVISLDIISAIFKDGDVVTKEVLVANGVLKKYQIAKILNNGELTKKVTFGPDVRVSKSITEAKPAAKAAKASKEEVAEPAAEKVDLSDEKSDKIKVVKVAPKATKAKTTVKKAK